MLVFPTFESPRRIILKVKDISFINLLMLIDEKESKRKLQIKVDLIHVFGC
jgi:hypothetical protein